MRYPEYATSRARLDAAAQLKGLAAVRGAACHLPHAEHIQNQLAVSIQARAVSLSINMCPERGADALFSVMGPLRFADAFRGGVGLIGPRDLTGLLDWAGRGLEAIQLGTATVPLVGR